MLFRMIIQLVVLSQPKVFVDGEEPVKRNLEHMFEDTGKEKLVRTTLIVLSMLYIIKILKENTVKGRTHKKRDDNAVWISQWELERARERVESPKLGCSPSERSGGRPRLLSHPARPLTARRGGRWRVFWEGSACVWVEWVTECWSV